MDESQSAARQGEMFAATRKTAGGSGRKRSSAGSSTRKSGKATTRKSTKVTPRKKAKAPPRTKAKVTTRKKAKVTTRKKTKAKPRKSVRATTQKSVKAGARKRKTGGGTQLALIEAGGSTVAPERGGQLELAAIEQFDPEPEAVPEARPAAAEAGPKQPGRRRSAAQMAAGQRAISVSEFFTKNRHLLGFDNPAKALLTTIKEAVDNSLDACEEAGILPDLEISIVPLADDRYRVVVQDNGPGIVRAQIPRIFGQLLYGSKFHTLKQARGQQGIGISAAGMYGQLTTGRPVVIESRTGKDRDAHHFEIQIDTQKNAPVIIKDEVTQWEAEHGLRVELDIEATYKRGRKSVDGYVEMTALANPHARIVYRPPVGEPLRYDRVAFELPPEPKAIKPHPHGIELGILMRMLSQTKSRNVRGFLQSDFSRVSARVADDIVKAAGIGASMSPRRVHRDAAEKLYQAIGKTKIMSPPTNCLSPIGEEQIMAGLRTYVDAEFMTAITRSPAVYRGNPFQIEVGLAYGGDLAADELAQVMRFANRVPLLYQPGACAISRSIVQTNWRSYGTQQSRGALPTGPLVVMVHIASAWVPFTSESKEAIAGYPEIVKEIKLALQICGRRLGMHIRRGQRLRDEEKKQSYIQQYIPHVGIALREILDLTEGQERKVVDTLTGTLERSRKM